MSHDSTQAITISSALSGSAPTMSSREIAELTGKRHRDVMRDIRVMLGKVEEDERKFARIYQDRHGRDQQEYALTQDLTYNLVLGYDPVLRLKVVRRWMELETSAEPAPKAKRTRKPSVTAIFKSRFAIARLIGLDDNQSAIAAGRACEKKCGENPLPDMGLTYLEAPTQQRTMTATDIAQALNLPGKQPGMAGNNLMEAAGLQTFKRNKRNKKVWTPTETGMPFARLCDVGKEHSDGAVPTYQWLPSILDVLRLHLATATEAPPFAKKPEPVS